MKKNEIRSTREGRWMCVCEARFDDLGELEDHQMECAMQSPPVRARFKEQKNACDADVMEVVGISKENVARIVQSLMKGKFRNKIADKEVD